MCAHAARIARQHEKNQAPGIAFTFLCVLYRIHKSVLGRKLNSTMGAY